MAGCARTPGPTGPVPAARAVTSIEYTTGPCFGACPVYRFSISSDGNGTFEGRKHTGVTGTRRFSLTRAEYDAFVAALSRFRPAPDTEREIVPGTPDCKAAATDLPSVEVRWEYADARTSRLDYYFGCDMEANRAMADAIGNAPDLIPALTPLIGERP
ncbi:DUF6438 domain-containing protein [Sphingomonas sp. J315]|nr:DUF6438 domain-containing protein [Sphingomonas sp. J315]UUY01392.1 DUF6438 domain-containing protein [Sphingomonas sp. J315]